MFVATISTRDRLIRAHANLPTACAQLCYVIFFFASIYLPSTYYVEYNFTCATRRWWLNLLWTRRLLLKNRRKFSFRYRTNAAPHPNQLRINSVANSLSLSAFVGCRCCRGERKKTFLSPYWFAVVCERFWLWFWYFFETTSEWLFEFLSSSFIFLKLSEGQKNWPESLLKGREKSRRGVV